MGRACPGPDISAIKGPGDLSKGVAMPYVVPIRFGVLANNGDFRTSILDLVENDQVVVRTERGTEVGLVLGKPAEVAEIREDITGEVIRRAGEEDHQEACRVADAQIQTELRYCRTKIREHNLPMKLVNVEHLLGGEKIIFYFIAEGRIDFRELVKDLAHEYHTRIELKQIGVRDEARLLADIDHCGREICCRSWMRRLEPVTMKMAKAQKATLDPAKISGRCGRLMCCLRYEDSVYEDLKKNLPRKGQQVVTAEGTAEVINYDILAQTLTAEFPDGRRLRIGMADVIKVLPKDPSSDKSSERSRNSSNRNRHGDSSRSPRPSPQPAVAAEVAPIPTPTPAPAEPVAVEPQPSVVVEPPPVATEPAPPAPEVKES